METPVSRETPESEQQFLSEEELMAAVADMPEELEQDGSNEKVVAGESIGIKETERIGLGLRSMQTKEELEKRKKKRKRRLLISILILLLIVCSVVTIYLKKKAATEANAVESSEDVVTTENQELLYGEITSIQGNEIIYDLVAEDEDTSNKMKSPSTNNNGKNVADGKDGSAQSKEMSGSDGVSSGMAEMSGNDGASDEMQGMSGSDGASNGMPEMSDSDSSSSGIPEMSGSDGANNGMAEMSDSDSSSSGIPEMPGSDGVNGGMADVSGEDMPDMGEDSKPSVSTMTVTKTYHSLGKEPVQTTIPVGTDVITKLGTTTTFARLASGDVIQMLVEKDGEQEVIVKIWIVG